MALFVQGINSIEMGNEAISYVQKKFYADFGPVSEYNNFP